MIRSKALIFILLIFFSIISVFAVWSDIYRIHSKLNNITLVDKKIKKIELFKQVVTQIQRERGLTLIYFSNPISKYLIVLRKQRAITQNVINSFKDKIQINNVKKRIFFLHEEIKNKKSTQEKVFNSYTNLILNILLKSEHLILYANNTNIKNDLFFYQQLSMIQEYIGQLRAIIGGSLAKKNITYKMYRNVVGLYALVENHITALNSYTNIKNINLWKPIQKRKCIRETKNIVNNIINKPLSHISVNALKWFKISTCAINSVNSSAKKYLAQIELKITKIHDNLRATLFLHIMFWICFFMIVFIVGIILLKSDRKFLLEHKLLEDYKKAIDNSTLVSKTDKDGIITYVNQAFCDITGYSRKELIGQTFHMLRDPDTSSTVYKNLWDTIQSGKTWHGEIENFAKNGQPFWIDAAISPIYDHNNNLVEYIAIRYNITKLMKLNEEIKNTQYELIYRMGESVESRSKESGNHIRRVAHYSKLLGQLYGIDNQLCDELFIASTMHDMGKIAIPDAILLKPGKLNDDEWTIMKTHTTIGYKILSGSNLPILHMAADIAHEHHERYNGAGYPRGIRADEISIYARIVSIVDVFDALISKRVYKKAWEYDRVITLIKEQSGQQFDPNLVKLFLDNINQFMKIKQKFKD